MAEPILPPNVLTKADPEDSVVAITESQISTLVDVFYLKVREDSTIGPIFNRAIDDWPRHLVLLKNFWSTVLLTTGAYRGDPMATHLKLPLEQRHFERWLALFKETAIEHLSAHNAARVISKSEQIAKNFQAAIAYKRGQTDVHSRP
jgi:hemoglobin